MLYSYLGTKLFVEQNDTLEVLNSPQRLGNFGSYICLDKTCYNTLWFWWQQQQQQPLFSPNPPVPIRKTNMQPNMQQNAQQNVQQNMQPLQVRKYNLLLGTVVIPLFFIKDVYSLASL